MSHHHDHTDIVNIKVAFLLNLLFTIVEFLGGWYTNSTAIISDAVHDLGDCLSIAGAWYFQKLSKRGSDQNFSYGYKRFSLLGAIINSVVLLAGGLTVLFIAVPRLFHPEQTKPGTMLVLAVFGVLVNGLAMAKLKKGHSMNERVVSLHLLEDVLGWVAVLIGSLVMMFFDIPILDPILSIAITIFILFNVFRNIHRSLKIILQGVPMGTNVEDLTSSIKKWDEVYDIHDLHIWSVDGIYNILTVHVVTSNKLNMCELSILKRKIRSSLQEVNIEHITIEFESRDEDCCFENCS